MDPRGEEPDQAVPFDLNAIYKIANIKLYLYLNNIQKELIRLIKNRPSKEEDSQSYYTYRARQEQINYEIAFFQSTKAFIQGHWSQAIVLYRLASHHLHRRTGYEEKVYKIWLKRLKANENPPEPDIVFINHGINQRHLIA